MSSVSNEALSIATNEVDKRDIAAATPRLPDFNYQPKPYTGPSKEEVLQMRDQYMNPAIFKYYKKPLMLVEGKMQYVFDETGRRYLDCFGGIVTGTIPSTWSE